jgi:hypothetical protein
MALPQQLEVLMGQPGNNEEGEQQQVEEEEGDELAAEWLDKVSKQGRVHSSLKC